MATDMFLTLDGILGESSDVKHPDAIEISAWETSYEQPGAEAKSATGPSIERVKPEPVTITKMLDAATPMLLQRIWAGKIIMNGEIACYRADDDGGSPIQYLLIKMQHILITAFSISGGEGQLPEESVALSVGHIEYMYNPQLKEGGSEGVIAADMNFITGQYGGDE